MASEQSPLLSNTHSNNYPPSERVTEKRQQRAAGVTDTDITTEYTSLYPSHSVTNSVNSSDDDVKLSTDSSSFMPHTTK